MSEDAKKPASVVREHAPTAVVLALLAGLGVWGHRTGWRAPAFAELTGGGGVTAKEDWCVDHNVPLSRCIACDPALVGGNPADWCKEHGVAESQCTLCHPELLTKGVADDWCREHGVPESGCTLCHPEIAVKGTPPADPGATQVVRDDGHGHDKEHGPGDGHDHGPGAAAPESCRSHLLKVQFASAESLRKSGIGLAAVEERPMTLRLAAAAETDYDQERVARVSSRLPGTLHRVYRSVGDAVKRGDLLALVDAPEVGAAKAALVQASAAADLKEEALERLRESVKAGFRNRSEQQEAEAALREARLLLAGARQALANLGLPVRAEDLAGTGDGDLVERLRFAGLPAAARESLDPGTATANLLPVTAPQDGVVLSREAVAGEVVEAAHALFVVADLRRMRVHLAVRQEEIGFVRPGQAISFRADGAPDEAVTGVVSWIATGADERTRTVRVRADVENPQGRLRAGTFGSGRITVREESRAVTVPDAAVQWEGCCNVVFVRLADGIFQTRKVRFGVRVGGFSEVLAGVSAGEVVVAAGSHVLKADILKSRLGAGCCHE